MLFKEKEGSVNTALPFRENVMVGLTHNEDGSPIIRVPRALKVGIGIPRGKALRVFIHPTDRQTPWYLGEGYYDGKSMKERWHKFADRHACEAKYVELRDRDKPAVPDCTYPRKLKFFTFSKPMVTDKGAEAYEPDFDAIEAHGATPTRIPIIFTSGDVLRMNYQMWSATELRCKGDGVNAMRSVLIGTDKDSGWKEAMAAGERYFPIIDGCKQRGCQFAEKKECKPGLGINFQTANHYLIGTTASFHTTGFESCRRTFSSFYDIKVAVEKATGRDVTGLGVYLSMRPYVVHPKGQKASTQQAVHVELPLQAQKSIVAQLRAMFEEEEPKQITAPQAEVKSAPENNSIIDAEEDTDGEIGEDPIGAAGMAAEFYPETVDAAPDDIQATLPAQQATQQKQEAVGEKLKKAREAKPQPDAVPLPWTNAEHMKKVLDAQKSRVGVKAYSDLLAEKKWVTGDLKPEGGVSVELYQILKGLPDDVTDAAQTKLLDDDPF